MANVAEAPGNLAEGIRAGARHQGHRGQIEFDIETFGQASNNGQMIEELNAKAKSVANFRDIALTIAHRKDMKVEKKAQSASAFAPLLEKLKLKR